MSASNKLGKRLLSMLLAMVLTLSMLVVPAAAQAVDTTDFTAGEAVKLDPIEGVEVLETEYLPERALALQQMSEPVLSGGSAPEGYVDAREYGDVSVVLHTVEMEPVGMHGFEGEYALPSNPNEIVEIVVQFRTPPTTVLGLMRDVSHPFIAEMEQKLALGRNAVGASADEAIARAAHSAFESELQEAVNAANSAGVFNNSVAAVSANEMIFEATDAIFNGALMAVPSALVPQIAAMDEVFVVTPNYVMEMHTDDDAFEQELDFMLDLAAQMNASQENLLQDLLNMNSDTPAPRNDWSPGLSSWSNQFMQEAKERYELANVHGAGGHGGRAITGAGVRMVVLDSGQDFKHPRFVPYYSAQPVGGPAGTTAQRVPGSGNGSAVNVFTIPTQMDPEWTAGWGDGSNHGTHVSGSTIGMAPGVHLYGYRIALGGAGVPDRLIQANGTPFYIPNANTPNAWAAQLAFDQIWRDGHRGVPQNQHQRFTRNIMNNSWGNQNNDPFTGTSYLVNVLMLTGEYVVVNSAGNAGPGLGTVGQPTPASLPIAVGAGRAGGWVSPWYYEGSIVSRRTGGTDTAPTYGPESAPISVDIHTWDFAWTGLDANGWPEAYPKNMEEIMKQVFSRPVVSYATMQSETNPIPRWRRGNGLIGGDMANAQWVWLGAIEDSDAARNNAAAQLAAMTPPVSVEGKIIVQHRNSAGTAGQQNPRNYWAQRGAAGVIIVDGQPAGHSHTYSGGAGPQWLIQGSIPLMSVPRLQAQGVFPAPAGRVSFATHNTDPANPFPVFTGTTTAATRIADFGAQGTINLTGWKDYSAWDANGMWRNTRRAPNYLAAFSSVGPRGSINHVAPDIVAPGTHIHSTNPAHSTDRWGRAVTTPVPVAERTPLSRNLNFAISPTTDEVVNPNLTAGQEHRAPRLAGAPYERPNMNAGWNPDWSTAYAMFMGTSMSSPTMAGLTALVWDAFPNAKPWEVKARIMNTAMPLGKNYDHEDFPNIHEEIDDIAYSVVQVGAGGVDIVRAVTQRPFATAEVDMAWMFSPTHPGTPGTPTGPAIGNPPAGAQAVLMTTIQSSLSFGSVYGQTSKPLVVTIHESGAEPWTVTADYNNSTKPDERPHLAHHADVKVVATARTALVGNNRLYDVTMEFGNAPDGLYGGNLVFTRGNERITMPFLGVPTNAPPDFRFSPWSGITNPIMTSIVGVNGQEDPRHVSTIWEAIDGWLTPFPAAPGQMTHSNWTSAFFGIDQLTAGMPSARPVDLYARRITGGTPTVPVFAPMTDAIYYASAFVTPRALGTADASTAGAVTLQQEIKARVPSLTNPNVTVPLDQGVYQLFVAVHQEPPRVVGNQIVRPDINSAYHMPLSRFVVSNTRPTLNFTQVEREGKKLTIAGNASSYGHNTAIQHEMRTNRNTGHGVILAPQVFDYRYMVLFNDHPIWPNYYLNADGTFEIVFDFEDEDEAVAFANDIEAMNSGETAVTVPMFVADGVMPDWWLPPYTNVIGGMGRLTSTVEEAVYDTPPDDIEIDIPGLDRDPGTGIFFLSPEERDEDEDTVLDIDISFTDIFGSDLDVDLDDEDVYIVWVLSVADLTPPESPLYMAHSDTITEPDFGISFNMVTHELTIPATAPANLLIELAAALVVEEELISVSVIEIVIVDDAKNLGLTAVGVQGGQAGVTPLERGTTRQFTATVTPADFVPEKGFLWAILGAEHPDTRMNTQTGLLTVARTETASELEVVVLSLDNLVRTAQVTVPLVGDQVELFFTTPGSVMRGRSAQLPYHLVHTGNASSVVKVELLPGINNTTITPVPGANYIELQVGRDERANSLQVRLTPEHDDTQSITRTIRIVDVPAVPTPSGGRPAGHVVASAPPRVNYSSPAPGTPAFLVASSAAHANNVLNGFSEGLSTGATAVAGISAESLLASVQSGIAADVSVAWSANTPFAIVQPTATTPGRITGVLVVTIGNSATAVLVNIEIPRLGEEAVPTTATSEQETTEDPEE